MDGSYDFHKTSPTRYAILDTDGREIGDMVRITSTYGGRGSASWHIRVHCGPYCGGAKTWPQARELVDRALAHMAGA